MALMLKLALPIMGPIPSERELCKLHHECLSELAEVGHLNPLDSAFGGASFDIQLLKSPDEEPLLTGKWKPPFDFRKFSLLNIKVDGAACAEHIQRSSESVAGRFTESEMESLCQQQAVSFLELEANFLLLAANIARPGSISSVEGYAFIDGVYVARTKPFFAEDLFSAVTASKEVGWPKLLFPSTLQTWQWLEKARALVDGIGTGRLGRALSALSHLTAPNTSQTSSIGLVWILLGLEALYSRGNVGLKEQLLGKAEVILGPRTENKRLFGAVYDFRSRLVHGDVDIPVRFSEFDAVEKYENFHAELYQSESIALAALLGTLQWMIRQDVFQLDFGYALRADAPDAKKAI